MIEIKYSGGCDPLAGLSEVYVAVGADGVTFGKDDSHGILSLLSQPAGQSTML